MSFTNERRQQVERILVKAYITALQNAGFALHGVANSAEEDIVKTRIVKVALEEAFATDEAHVFFELDGKGRKGWLFFVLGNGGWDVLTDYSCPDDFPLFAQTIESLDPLVDKYADEDAR